jgi:hypothetical protein
MQLTTILNKHPATVGETYGEHFMSAMGFSLSMIRGAICCAIHAFLPFLCERHGSEAITRLHDRMVSNRSRLAARSEPGASAIETSS